MHEACFNSTSSKLSIICFEAVPSAVRHRWPKPFHEHSTCFRTRQEANFQAPISNDNHGGLDSSGCPKSRTAATRDAARWVMAKFGPARLLDRRPRASGPSNALDWTALTTHSRLARAVLLFEVWRPAGPACGGGELFEGELLVGRWGQALERNGFLYPQKSEVTSRDVRIIVREACHAGPLPRY